MTFITRFVPPERDDDGGSRLAVPSVPADWLELCRQEFLRRYFQQTSGDEYEFSPNVYGDEP